MKFRQARKKQKGNYEEMIKFVLKAYDLSTSTFKLIVLGEEKWRRFLIGQYYFEYQDDIESEIIEGRIKEEYEFSPDLKFKLEKQYALCLGIDDKNLIKGWLDIHEQNKQNPLYSQLLAQHLDVFFEHVRELLNYDFLIIYNPQKLAKFFPKKKRGIAMVEEALHFCYKRGKKVPIKHGEVARLSKKILQEFRKKK